MEKFTKLLKLYFLANLYIFTACCLLGVLSSLIRLDIKALLICFPFTCPGLFLFIYRRRKKALNPKLTSNNCGKENSEMKNICAVPTEQTTAIGYVDTGSVIIKSDGSAITDEDAPYLIKMGFDNSVKMEYGSIQGMNDIFQEHSLSNEERIFFTAFSEALTVNKLKPAQLRLNRLSNKTFSVEYAPVCYVGKIKLTGSSFYMQYSIGLTSHKELIGATLEECIETIPRWIRYIKYCKRI